VYLRIYVRAYLVSPCVSANDNVKQLKLLDMCLTVQIDKMK